MADPAAPASRRGRRPDGDARRALIEAAQAILAVKPAGKLTVREVAARAGCDVAMVNYYFGSKEGLLTAALDDALEEMSRVLASVTASEGTLAEKMANLVREPILAMGERRHLPRLIIGQVLLERGKRADRYIATMGVSYLESVEALVEQGIRSGTFRKVDARSLVYSFAAIPAFFFLMAPVLERVLGEEAVSTQAVETFAEAVADLVLHGLVARPDDAG